MAEYFKYVSRDADSQINWAEVGQQAVGTLQNWYQAREEKKEAYKQANRESINNLMDAPQGQNQDANNFINNYSHDMINQKMIDKDLFERGLLSERDYTLRMQNQMDGTKQLFQIQKLYQENFAATMEGIQNGTLQSGINTFNMSMVEGYGDFNNSKATINPEDGSVGIGLMENKIVDGKVVRVLSKNIAPVNVIRGKILQKVPTFDVDGKTTNLVKNLGDIKDAIYRAASTSRAGTITELTGLQFLKTVKDPATRAIVNNFNDAINDQVNSYFSNPYNLTSVLTENLGTYNSNSFTFDKDVADKDPNKILLKIDPTTQMGTLDENGKNYKKQKEEANNYVKTQILSKLDAERKVSTTGQLSESEEAKQRAAYKYRPRTGEEPVAIGEILEVTSTDPTTKKISKIGVTQGIDNLIVDEGKGIQNVVNSIGYNASNGKLEMKGYQITGKEEEGRRMPGEEEGAVGTTGSTVVKQKDFLVNDKNNARLLSTMVKRIPNPERRGYNFSSIIEAKDYYKRQYQDILNKPKSTSNTIQFDAQGNIIE